MYTRAKSILIDSRKSSLFFCSFYILLQRALNHEPDFWRYFLTACYIPLLSSKVFFIRLIPPPLKEVRQKSQ
ncbi:UNVERIFIED_CONTAM: hypothetical protein Slati_2953700, partial [Sesamum latifolium]